MREHLEHSGAFGSIRKHSGAFGSIREHSEYSEVFGTFGSIRGIREYSKAFGSITGTAANTTGITAADKAKITTSHPTTPTTDTVCVCVLYVVDAPYAVCVRVSARRTLYAHMRTWRAWM